MLKIKNVDLKTTFIFFFTSFFRYCLSSVTQDEDCVSQKRLCFFKLFFMCRRIGEYISLELFCFVNLTSSCAFTHCQSVILFSRLPFPVNFYTSGTAFREQARCENASRSIPCVAEIRDGVRRVGTDESLAFSLKPIWPGVKRLGKWELWC